MKSFDDIINDKESLNEGLYDKWKDKFVDRASSQVTMTTDMLLDIMRKLDEIEDRIRRIPAA